MQLCKQWVLAEMGAQAFLLPPPYSLHTKRQGTRKVTLGKLSDHAEVGWRFKIIQHADDVLMAQRAEDLNLLPQALDVLLRLAVLHDELHGNHLPCEPPPPLVHLCQHEKYCMMQGMQSMLLMAGG